eukprot:gnl/TRDRNA2_/TRDRNA2_71896_c0_seq1.p1 gnl/TRDRNA2_/TRDRNA2_71896_c0~~gnl/TRDRNA2_/TRDRNA2_71896_c0_seq1.p1  ORF type:complete len:175 (+),score=11.16 gnl/TRDRNA2_/TRDRNA2_71896_c0_seq1:72-596(+)
MTMLLLWPIPSQLFRLPMLCIPMPRTNAACHLERHPPQKQRYLSHSQKVDAVRSRVNGKLCIRALRHNQRHRSTYPCLFPNHQTVQKVMTRSSLTGERKAVHSGTSAQSEASFHLSVSVSKSSDSSEGDDAQGLRRQAVPGTSGKQRAIETARATLRAATSEQASTAASRNDSP